MLNGSFVNNPTTTVPSIRAKAGENVELKYVDSSGGVIESAANGVSNEWFVDCEQSGLRHAQTGEVLSHVFIAPQKCYGALLTRVNISGGCNVCSEYDAFAGRSVTPFEIEILPADYTSPPLPGPIQNLVKRVYSQRITYDWNAPANASDVGELAYIIRDKDQSILGVTDKTKLEVIDVPAGQDPELSVSVGNNNGIGGPINSNDAEVILIEGTNSDQSGADGLSDTNDNSILSGNELAGTVAMPTRPLSSLSAPTSSLDIGTQLGIWLEPQLKSPNNTNISRTPLTHSADSATTKGTEYLNQNYVQLMIALSIISVLALLLFKHYHTKT